jgi:DNA-binding IclR family transcriptional regulator
MGYVERGHLIRELLRLLQTLDVKKAMTVKELSDESGMGLRQVYRWLKALEAENLIERFDRFPARYRLKPVGSKLRRSIMD